MPDGALAWGQSWLYGEASDAPLSGLLFRTSAAQFTVDDRTRGRYYTGTIDTLGVDELTLDLATGVMSRGAPPPPPRVTVSGNVLLEPTLPLGNIARATLTCDGQQSMGQVVDDGSFTVTVYGSTSSVCTLEVRVEQGLTTTTFRRDVSIVDRVGAADFAMPPLLRVNVIDSLGDPLLVAGVINAFEDGVPMPDGGTAYVFTTASVIPVGPPIDIISLRDTVTYVNIEDYTHDARLLGADRHDRCRRDHVRPRHRHAQRWRAERRRRRCARRGRGRRPERRRRQQRRHARRRAGERHVVALVRRPLRHPCRTGRDDVGRRDCRRSVHGRSAARRATRCPTGCCRSPSTGWPSAAPPRFASSRRRLRR